MAHFTVIGLGRFGSTTSLELTNLGHSVTGIDNDRELVNHFADDLFQTIQCDVTDDRAIGELDLEQSDAVLVAIGENMESSLLCTLNLKNLNVKNIWVKANTHAHHSILAKLNVARIIHPEQEMGIRIAQALNYPMVNDYLAIGHGYFVVEVKLVERLNGKSLASIVGEKNNHIDVLLVKRARELIKQPDMEFIVEFDDTILFCGTREQLFELAPRLR